LDFPVRKFIKVLKTGFYTAAIIIVPYSRAERWLQAAPQLTASASLGVRLTDANGGTGMSA
jgi:hypothetical protein